MADNLNKQPKRGILKSSTSFEKREHDLQSGQGKNPHFDEQNILATFHPPDKDYGFMKIDEPKTPYEYASEGEEEEYDEDGNLKQQERPDELDADLLAAKIAADGPKGPRPRRVSEPSGDEEDLQLLTPEEREHRRKFEQKRKAHYNEFYAVKMARQLMEQEDDDEVDSSNTGNGDSAEGETGSTEDVEPKDGVQVGTTEINVQELAANLSEDESQTASTSSPMDTADGTSV